MKSLINNVMARWHLGCWMTNESEDAEVTELFLKILDKSWKSMNISRHYVTITTVDNETMQFWNANKYYSWASHGSISNHSKALSWKDHRPSMCAMYLMVKRIEQWQANEHQRLTSVLVK